MGNPLQAIGDLGQSVWYDNLGRELLRSGELKRMVEEDGVRGVTSNPTIFEKAIGKERIYDGDVHALVDAGLNVHDIYEGLAVEDIRQAADLLLPVFAESDGADGYVSLEVSPHLAYDRAGTVTQARRLFELTDRKNLMIKVPATPQGLAAVKELISVGVNVNVTLIFSLEQYQEAAAAYIEGLELWTAAGGDPKRPASVASFFVSRVDTMVDDRLKDIADPAFKATASALLGKTAIANARIAYSLYKEIFHGDRFAALRERGAKPQRVLWASTSTKNPNYPDTYYVDALLGPETVNTMPAATLAAYRDHGQPQLRLEDALDEAKETFVQLAEVGVNMEDVMAALLEDGVKSFADSFDLLLDGISRKRTRLLRGWGHRSASLGMLQKQVDETLSRLDKEKLADNMWNCDASVWSDQPEEVNEIGRRLGWLNVVETMMGEIERLNDFAEDIKSEGFTSAVLLGMGGSSLAPEVFATCFGKREGYLDLKVLDTTVPTAILDVERSVDLERTLFIVASKSGGTIEVVSLYKYFFRRMEKLVGNAAGSRFIAITDPGTCLGKLAAEKGFRRTFLNPSDIGGRFSALSYFGLVPAVLVGVDLERLLMRAAQAVEASGPGVPSLESPGVWLGVIMAEAALAGKDKLTLIPSPSIASLGYWLEQLIAESTGKEAKGILPVEGEPLGASESYGVDRLFVYLRLDEEGMYDQQVSSLEASGQPVVTLRLHSPYDLGREMFRWEFATAVAGEILGINPFDQPDVQASKDITKEYLEIFKKEGKIPSADQVDIDAPDLTDALGSFLGSVQPGEYVAFNAFVPHSETNREMLTRIRSAVREKSSTTTTLGFGPRYLHSTGQMHKGGPNSGNFVLITAEEREDVEIPEEPYTFGTLKTAQSMGDYGALKKAGRKVLMVHLGSEADLGKLLEAVKQAT
jgi:transaldolase / glucose-6-phosphate isomerase